MATKKSTPKAAPEPQFSEIAATLAAAERQAKAASADAIQARAARQQAALGAIRSAFAQTLDGATIRKTLLGAGVLKGTVSKIVTVIDALREGIITLDDVKSLNGAYNSVRAARAVAAGTHPAAAPIPVPAPAAPVVATTPEAALDIILDAIKNAGNEDAVFKAAGDWIDRITNAISAVTKAVSEEE